MLVCVKGELPEPDIDIDAIIYLFNLLLYNTYMDERPSAISSEAFSIRYAELQPGLVRYAGKLTMQHEDAEDVVQDAMLKVWKRSTNPNLPPLDTTTDWGPYAYTTVRTRAFDAHRAAKCRPRTVMYDDEDSDRLVDPRQDPTAPYGAIDLWLGIKNVLGGSTEKIQALKLHMQGLSEQAIADRLGIPCGTVKSRIHYAKKAIKEAASEGGILEGYNL